YITRPVPNPVLLPPLLGVLEAAGIPRAAITLLVATGMHRPNEGAELDELLGPELPRRYRVVNHDCHDPAGLGRVTELEGHPVEINRRYLEADLKVLTGLIEPHAYAGFSGGAKSIAPGLASFATMKFLHSYALLARPEVELGRVEGNPFREHLDRVRAAAGADFLVNAVIDGQRRIVGLFAGHPCQAFRAGCDLAARHQIAVLDRLADLVVTTGGGHPLDRSLYQASKGLVTACTMVRPGGTVVLVADCTEGLGSGGFAEVLRTARTPAGFRALYSDPARFTVDQWAAQAFFRALEHAGRVLLCSPGLSREESAAVGLEGLDDLDRAVAHTLAGGGTVVVAPEGPYVSARLAAP
ncbi:MAG: lactate racemase domain-containing protein, partial [Deferrisomatales bacterium]